LSAFPANDDGEAAHDAGLGSAFGDGVAGRSGGRELKVAAFVGFEIEVGFVSPGGAGKKLGDVIGGPFRGRAAVPEGCGCGESARGEKGSGGAKEGSAGIR
jgi:hypothetical protein